MTRKPNRPWTKESLLELSRSYQAAAIIGAAADLDLFSSVAPAPASAADLARRLRCQPRGLTILLDALVALRLLAKSGDHYRLPSIVGDHLTPEGPQTVLAMAQHQANCLRLWVQLAQVVKMGRPARRIPSVRGEAGDKESFIGAMDNIAAPNADHVIRAIRPLLFRKLLDVGGASGTWALAFLRACPAAEATIFDLPHVIPMARRRLAAARMQRRVRLVAGDFMKDPLPPGADLAWVSAIVHQNSRAQNRELFAKVFQALVPGGRIAIRDILMEANHTQPVAGALFAVNMLVATQGGGTFTFAELREDMAAAGFIRAAIMRRDKAMNAVVIAQKPGAE